MAIVTGHCKVCADIAAALGIKNCRRLDIHMAVNEVVSVTAEYYPEVDGLLQLEPILKHFELHEKKEKKE